MAYRKLGRTSEHRKAMLRNLTTDLLVNEKIVTTEQRAKEVRKFADKMITLGKKGDLTSRRRAASYLMNVVADVKEDGDDVVIQTAVQKLFDDLAPRTPGSLRWISVGAMLHKKLSLNWLTNSDNY